MTGIELRERRTRLEMPLDRLAETLGEHRDEVERWEQVAQELPGSLSRRLEWLLATEERARLMQASGIEDCPWVEAHLKEVDTLPVKQLEARLQAAKEHRKSCATCQRREAYAATLPPLPQPPLSPTTRLLVTITQQIGHLPKWARPAATGALLIGGLTIVRALFVVVLRGVHPSLTLLGTILAAIGVGAYGGAVGGFAYALVRDRVRRFGRLGDYLTGLAVTYAYLLAFGIPATLFTQEETFREPVGWVIMVVGAAVFGLVIGHSWFRERPLRETRGSASTR